MLEYEGYKMFKGTAVVQPKTDAVAEFKVGGTWFFRPEWGCWYVNGKCFPADTVTHIVEEG